MEHQFTIPKRVVEVTEEPQEVDPDTGELLPPAPAATDDGTPMKKLAAQFARERETAGNSTA
jgi:hypothetical protein